MVLIRCRKSLLKSEKDQILRLHKDVKSIKILMEKEQFQRNEAMKKLKLPSSVQMDSFERLLNEGMIYMNRMSSYRRNQEAISLYHFLLKTLDLYTKVRLKFQDLMRQRERLLDGQNVTYYSERGLAIKVAFDVDESHNFQQFVNGNDYKVEEHEVMDAFELLTELPICCSYIINIVNCIKRIKEMCMNRWYFMLREYSMKLKQFLQSNRKVLKSNKCCRKNYSPQNCKYHLLKQLVWYTDQILMYHVQIIAKFKYFYKMDHKEYLELFDIVETSVIRSNIINKVAMKLKSRT